MKKKNIKMALTDVQAIRSLELLKFGDGRKLAKQYGVSPSVISDVLRNRSYVTASSVPHKHCARRLTSEQHQEVLDMYVAGNRSVTEIARHFNVSVPAINHLLKNKFKLEIHRPERLDFLGKEKLQQIVDLLKRNEELRLEMQTKYSLQAIAKVHGISHSTIWLIKNRMAANTLG